MADGSSGEIPRCARDDPTIVTASDERKHPHHAERIPVIPFAIAREWSSRGISRVAAEPPRTSARCGRGTLCPTRPTRRDPWLWQRAADAAAPRSRPPQGRGNPVPRWLRAGSRDGKAACTFGTALLRQRGRSAACSRHIPWPQPLCDTIQNSAPRWLDTLIRMCVVRNDIRWCRIPCTGLGTMRWPGGQRRRPRLSWRESPGLSTEVPMHMRRMSDVERRIGILRSG